MSNIKVNSNEKEQTASDPHEPTWINVDFEPRPVDTDPHPHRPEATVIGKGPGWTNFDIENNASAQQRWWLRKKKSIVVVGVAIVAMILIAVIVPTIVAVRHIIEAKEI